MYLCEDQWSRSKYLPEAVSIVYKTVDGFLRIVWGAGRTLNGIFELVVLTVGMSERNCYFFLVGNTVVDCVSDIEVILV